VEAAYQQFVEGGYGVPLTDIAAAAGVSVQNLYLHFTNKQKLVQAVLQLAVLGDDIPVPPHERPWFQQVIDAATPAAAIAIWVENTLPIYARVAPLAGIFLSEPDLADMWAHSEQLRLEGFRHVADVVATKGKLRVGVDIGSAADVMFVLLSPLLYREFVNGRNWASARWGEWATHALADILFQGAIARRSRPRPRSRRSARPA
jgi:AcrR family transcriptional regulator